MSNNILLRIALLITAFVFVYFDTFISLVRTWSGRDDYSHGFIVPLISFYFVYVSRDKLSNLSIEPKVIPGLIITALGLLILYLGNVGSVVSLQQSSLLIVVPGLVVLLLGTEYLKALSLPLGYLVLMISAIQDLILYPLHWPFQLFGAAGAELILKIVNIPVLRNGQFLELPNISLEVENSCSGIRYLVSILALAIPLAYFTQKRLSRRLILIGWALLIGIIINPIRVALIGVWAYNGHDIVHGPRHVFQGLSVSVVGFVFLFAGAWFMGKYTQRETKDKENAKSKNISAGDLGEIAIAEGEINEKETVAAHVNISSGSRIFNIAWFATVIILLLFGLVVHLYSSVPVPLQNTPGQLPFAVKEWKGRTAGDVEKKFDLPGPDIEIHRIYENSAGKKVDLIIGYFEEQRQDKELVHYTLDELYVNSGTIQILLDFGQTMPVRKKIVRRGKEYFIVLFWYDIGGRLIANNIEAKATTAIRGITTRKTNGSIIIVTSPLEIYSDADSVSIHQADFVRSIQPILSQYLQH